MLQYVLGMVVVLCFIWDKENQDHIARHKVTVEEVEEVCKGDHQAVESYRKRILIVGQTKTERSLAIVLSPEDKNLHLYEKGTYYVITAFEKGTKL